MAKGEQQKRLRMAAKERAARAREGKAERLAECRTLRHELERDGAKRVLDGLLGGNHKGLRRALAELRGRSEPQFEDGELEHLAAMATDNLEIYSRGILPDGDLEPHLLPLRIEVLRRLIWKGEANAAAYLAFRAGIDWERSRETLLLARDLTRTKQERDDGAARHRAHLARFQLGGDRRRGERLVPEEVILRTLEELRTKDPALGAWGQRMELYTATARRVHCSVRTVRRAVARHAKTVADHARLFSGPVSGPKSQNPTKTKRKPEKLPAG